MPTALVVALAFIFIIDGVLIIYGIINANEKPSLGQLIFRSVPGAAGRIGSALFYFCIAAACIWGLIAA